MPIYVFGCAACGNKWEELRKADSVPDECPSCHKDEVVQQVTAPSGFILKGDGWYKGSK